MVNVVLPLGAKRQVNLIIGDLLNISAHNESTLLGGGGGSEMEKFMKHKKPKINSVGWQHTRVYNNKTDKAQASRFFITASHHPSVRYINK